MVAGNVMFTCLFAFAAWGQTEDKVFYFTNLTSPQAMQDFVNAVRSVGDIRDVSLDAAKRSMTVKGTPEQIAIAGWLTGQLDQTASAPGTHDFAVNDPKAPLAQVIHLSHADSAQGLQEIVNAVRSVVDIQRFFPLIQEKAIVLRGFPQQVKAADWLVGLLDSPELLEDAAAGQYRLTPGEWDARGGLLIQVAAISGLESPQAAQELVNVTRSMADMQRVFPIWSRKALVMRASDEQIAVANWLVREFDGAARQGINEFPGPGPGGQIVQVAYVNAPTPESLQEAVTQIRSDTKMSRVYPFNPRAAVAMRGTADQLVRAQQVIRSLGGQ